MTVEGGYKVVHDQSPRWRPRLTNKLLCCSVFYVIERKGTHGTQTELLHYLGLGHSHMTFPEKELAIQIADVYRIQVNLRQYEGATQVQDD